MVEQEFPVRAYGAGEPSRGTDHRPPGSLLVD
jgi:hypothetical protein